MNRLMKPKALRQSLIAVLVAAAALVIAASALPAVAAPTDPPRVPAGEASQYVGRTAQVCGHVASAAYFASIKGSPTFLNLDRPYPDQTFTVVIWGTARTRFDGPPEKLFDGKSICVTGRVETYKGKPQIVLEDPAQIEATAPVGGGGELSDLERVLVKALLASLGHDLNYGTGEWDQETVEAVIAFQEQAGLPPTGEPDPETLRALANAVPDIADEDRTLAIRLVLFELVRRQE
jgi:hypothetical protein